ncbi:MAG TPA: histidine phosphatase family protein [Jiangellales bacterium]|nr:histidine phosphatase family protein [Jiangellales bacterium]
MTAAEPGGVRTVVHLLRHGEVYNPTKVLYGRLPGYRLSPLGEQMAHAAAKALAGRDVTVVVSSPLERARQTAEPIAVHFGLPLGIDERLIESENFFEGKRVGVGDGALRDPRNWHVLRNPFRPSWGEAYFEIAARMHAVLLDVRRRAEGHEAVCVSHQLPIWTLRRHLEHRRLWHDPRRRECALASVTSVHFLGESVVDITYQSPAAHLITGTAQSAKGA